MSEELGTDGLLKRRMNDPRGYGKDKWRGIIKDMFRIYDPATIEEGFDQILLVNK